MKRRLTRHDASLSPFLSPRLKTSSLMQCRPILQANTCSLRLRHRQVAWRLRRTGNINHDGSEIFSSCLRRYSQRTLSIANPPRLSGHIEYCLIKSTSNFRWNKTSACDLRGYECILHVCDVTVDAVVVIRDDETSSDDSEDNTCRLLRARLINDSHCLTRVSISTQMPRWLRRLRLLRRHGLN